MESNEWELALTIRRQPSKPKAFITQQEIDRLQLQLAQVAAKLGLTLVGVSKPKRVNCPDCGRIIRNPSDDHCPICGVNFKTGKVK